MTVDPYALASAPLLPWERQPTDNDDTWAAFVRFRDTPPPRKVIGVGRGSTKTAWDNYINNGWKARVDAYDRYLQRVMLEEEAAFLAVTARQRAARHLALLKDAYELASLELRKTLEASRNSDMAGLLKPAEITKLVEATIKLERLVSGETTEHVENSGPDLSKLSPAELEELDRLLGKQGGEEKATH